MSNKFILHTALFAFSTFLLVPFAAAQQVRSWAATQSHAPDVSDAAPGTEMQAGEALHITVSLQMRNKSGIDTLTTNLASGKSTKTLTKEDFLSQYAPTQDQVKAVVNHLSQSGFINIEVSPNHLLVTADGSAGSAKSAFNVTLQHFSVNGRSAYANVNDPIVPASLSNIVLGVHGLQTVHLSHTTLVPSEKNTSFNTTKTGKVGHSPSAWPSIYNATGIPTAANTTIGIIASGNMTQTLSDLNAFARSAGFAAPSVSTVSSGGNTNSRFGQQNASSDTAEWDIDSQNALGAAGGVVKSIVFYVANTLSDADLTAAYNAAVTANTASVINVSLGECETDAKRSGVEATDDQIFEAAVAQGQTFAVASGDAGSYECGGRTSAQSYPAASPYVIAVGGTSLSTTATGAWSAETVWACTSSSSCNNDGGTGGGASTTETAPGWQISSKVLGNSQKRGVPDIAFDADPESGSLTIVNGRATQYGGTSLATPIFVGFWARIQSAHSNSLVFPASALYSYGGANEANLFHDVTSGSNGAYSATTGWDYTTGFGSINVGNFAAFVANHSGF